MSDSLRPASRKTGIHSAMGSPRGTLHGQVASIRRQLRAMNICSSNRWLFGRAQSRRRIPGAVPRRGVLESFSSELCDSLSEASEWLRDSALAKGVVARSPCRWRSHGWRGEPTNCERRIIPEYSRPHGDELVCENVNSRTPLNS